MFILYGHVLCVYIQQFQHNVYQLFVKYSFKCTGGGGGSILDSTDIQSWADVTIIKLVIY